MSSVYTADADRERDAAERMEALADEHERAERTEALADEHDRDAARYPAPTPPHTLERIVHAQFQAFMLEVAIAGLYMKEHEFHAIDANALALKCEAFCDSLALMQAERTTALAAD